MKKSIVGEKSIVFALRIVRAYKYLVEEHKEYVLSKQLLRSGTAVGALIKEAEHAESKADFIHKMNIALKEANETNYWLLILKESEFIGVKEYKSINANSEELIKMLASIVKTTRKNLTNERAKK